MSMTCSCCSQPKRIILNPLPLEWPCALFPSLSRRLDTSYRNFKMKGCSNIFHSSKHSTQCNKFLRFRPRNKVGDELPLVSETAYPPVRKLNSKYFYGHSSSRNLLGLRVVVSAILIHAPQTLYKSKERERPPTNGKSCHLKAKRYVRALILDVPHVL